jgi:hypothetical protein
MRTLLTQVISIAELLSLNVSHIERIHDALPGCSKNIGKLQWRTRAQEIFRETLTRASSGNGQSEILMMMVVFISHELK